MSLDFRTDTPILRNVYLGAGKLLDELSCMDHMILLFSHGRCSPVVTQKNGQHRSSFVLFCFARLPLAALVFVLIARKRFETSVFLVHLRASRILFTQRNQSLPTDLPRKCGVREITVPRCLNSRPTTAIVENFVIYQTEPPGGARTRMDKKKECVCATIVDQRVSNSCKLK